MTGKEYLQDIKTNLEAGRNQHRMGQNLLSAFGYSRRRRTVIEEINATLDELGLTTLPSITVDMPLRIPRIIFSLKENVHQPVERLEATSPDGTNTPTSDINEGDIEDDTAPPELAFSISELASAQTEVGCVSPNATIQEAYTLMLRYKYSQLVVVSNTDNLRQDGIKGIVSFQSIAKALMNGNPETVGDCLDDSVPIVRWDADLKSVVPQLSEHDVVLVIGRERSLQGIVTAWDLAEEFAALVDPFRRIGEIEGRLRTLVGKRLGNDKVAAFLNEHLIPGANPIEDLEELTMGELQKVLSSRENWDKLGLGSTFDRNGFIDGFNEAREYRNRLMHFREPLNEGEMQNLTNFCDMVRAIQL